MLLVDVIETRLRHAFNNQLPGRCFDMSRNSSHYKRNLPSSPSSPMTDQKKMKTFVTPNRIAALDDSTASLPDAFSLPPITDLSPVQGEISNQTFTQAANNIPSYKARKIFIKDVTNFSKLKYDLITVLGPEAVTFKASKEFLTIRTANTNIFNKTVSYLDAIHSYFHTHAPQHLRPINAVIHHLHHSTPTEKIETALTDLGLSVLNVSIIQNKKTNIPLLLFLVNLDPKEHNLKIFQLKSKCGHTRNWCHHQPRCVKRRENHSTGDCTKPRDTCQMQFSSIEPPPIKLKNYAEVKRNHNNIDTSPSISTILYNFISNLNAIISPLISLLTTVLNSILTKVA
ncbi:Uncharacterized protein FWK35_00024711, partial [Aphis craccivora]